MRSLITYILKLLIIVLLLGCLLKMPYGYFQFVRLGTFIMFLVLAYHENKKKRIFTMLMCIACAILFNPFIKVHFIRHTWNAIDVGIACFVGVWLVVDFIPAPVKSGKP